METMSRGAGPFPLPTESMEGFEGQIGLSANLVAPLLYAASLRGFSSHRIGMQVASI